MMRDKISKSMEGFTIILFCSTLFSTLITSTAVDIIRENQTIRDGNTIVSAGGEFELGFFSPGSSTNRYLGIWYKKISTRTVVWVANRETPLSNTPGMVRVNNKGITVLTNGSDRIIWSLNLSRSVMNPVAQLLDTGNLVFRDEKDIDPVNFLWQSFDYPGDTLLPGMKFRLDLVTGLGRYFTSWKSADDPSPGSFTNRLDPNGFPQFLWWKGSMLWSRVGPWVGSKFSGSAKTRPNGIYKDEFVFNQKEIYYKFDLLNKSSPTTRYILTQNGNSKILIWNDRNQYWMVSLTMQVSDCDRYGLCGAYGSCNINNAPRCECLRGFVPQFPKNWEAADWSDGCVRKTPLDCGNRDGFIKYSGVKLPDMRHSWYNMSMNLEECERVCLKNCSCTAYTNADTRGGGSGCFLWFNELIDTSASTGDGQDLYVRMSASELGYMDESKRFTRRMQIIVIPVVPTILLALFLFVFKKRILKRGGRLKFSSKRIFPDKNEGEDFELPLFDFKKIANATNNFSHNNKLGEGGFGPVYKGMLNDGQEIAVKRLSGNSRQGVDEFKNEVSCIAKLQHRNLVALLGCCIDREERILIYEYMPNKSLDSFIFDEELSKSLDWSKRYNIINGIARGLLYLHQDSKLRIIHRDIKASNILLDHEMNPKISDFGMARSFKGSQIEANTTRVVGTYGYMPPEYAIDGLFSDKSDVYSFGVLVIEIVSGKKNRLFNHPDHSFNLVGHAWRSYKEHELLGLIDGAILESSNHNEVFRVIQIGLLCVQKYPEDRPSMSYVVLMLSSNTALPHPKEPGFFTDRKLHEAKYSASKPKLSSANQLTITDFAPRL